MHGRTIKLITSLIDSNLTVYGTLSGINVALTVLQHHSSTARLLIISTFSVTWLGAVYIHTSFSVLILKLRRILGHNWLIICMSASIRLSRFLGSSPWLSSWIVSWIMNKTILRNVLHQRIVMRIVSRINYSTSMGTLTDLIMMLW